MQEHSCKCEENICTQLWRCLMSAKNLAANSAHPPSYYSADWGRGKTNLFVPTCISALVASFLHQLVINNHDLSKTQECTSLRYGKSFSNLSKVTFLLVRTADLLSVELHHIRILYNGCLRTLPSLMCSPCLSIIYLQKEEADMFSFPPLPRMMMQGGEEAEAEMEAVYSFFFGERLACCPCLPFDERKPPPSLPPSLPSHRKYALALPSLSLPSLPFASCVCVGGCLCVRVTRPQEGSQ